MRSRKNNCMLKKLQHTLREVLKKLSSMSCPYFWNYDHYVLCHLLCTMKSTEVQTLGAVQWSHRYSSVTGHSLWDSAVTHGGRWKYCMRVVTTIYIDQCWVAYSYQGILYEAVSHLLVSPARPNSTVLHSEKDDFMQNRSVLSNFRCKANQGCDTQHWQWLPHHRCVWALSCHPTLSYLILSTPSNPI